MSFRQQEAVQPQTALDLLTAIGGTKSLSTLDGLLPGAVDRLGGGAVHRRAGAEPFGGDRGAPAGGEGDRPAGGPRSAGGGAGQPAAGRPSHFPPKRKAARSPNRRASIERRRTLAASGPMPPQLASQFTTGELAALRIVADAVRERGACMLTLGEIAARAGVCVTTARNALRTGRARGARHHRGAPARQAAEPRQCGAGGLAGMEDVDRARPEKRARPRKRQRFRFRGGRVQKNRGHG